MKKELDLMFISSIFTITDESPQEMQTREKESFLWKHNHLNIHEKIVVAAPGDWLRVSSFFPYETKHTIKVSCCTYFDECRLHTLIKQSITEYKCTVLSDILKSIPNIYFTI